MRSSPLIFVAVALAMVAVAFAGTTPEVITLTDADFHQALADVPNAVWLVEFYAPWCGHCKRLAPIWDELAISLHSRDDVELRVAKVDCTENQDIASAFGIRGFPTIKLISDKTVYDVSVPRTVEAFTDYVNNKEAWKTPTALPTQKAAGVKIGKPQAQRAAAEPEVAPLLPFDLDVQKILDSALELPFTNPYASGTLLLIGFLMGLLTSLIVCFPTPRVVNLQHPDDIKKPAPTGPKIKEE